jgi:PhnB protein
MAKKATLTRMKMNPYLTFSGQARQALEFYRDVLNGEITQIMTYGESPMAAEIPAEGHDSVMHSQLEAGDVTLMAADGPPNSAAAGNVSIALHIEDIAEAERIFAALAEGDGAEVSMPLQETFWAKRFGMLVDQYGVPWLINGGLGEEYS